MKLIHPFVLLKLSVFLVAILIGLQAGAQDAPRQDDFFMGEAIGTETGKVKMEARKELILSIQNILSVESSSSTSETEKGIYSSMKQKINSWSWIKISGISFSTFDLADGKIKVIAYLSKADYRKSMDDLAAELTTAFQIASDREKVTGLTSVIPDYYLIYLKSWYSPEPVRFGDIQDLKSYISGKIKGFLKDVIIVQGDLSVDGTDDPSVSIPLQFSWNRQPVNGFTFREDLDNGTPRLVIDGQSLLVSHSFPSDLRKTLKLRLAPQFDSQISTADLEEIHSLFPIEEIRTVILDFSGLISVDFSVSNSGNDILVFKPAVKNLSVSSLEWDFGDGTKSFEQSPRQIYLEKDKSYDVKLTVNRNKIFSISKKLSADGKWLDEKSARSSSPSLSPVPKSSEDLKVSLLKVTHADVLLSRFQELKPTGRVIFGAKKDFLFPEKCWVVVYHAQTKEISTWLEPVSEGYREVKSGKTVKNLKDAYKGLSAIWVEFK
ncbi:MAG: PKD domain-containing protein [Bacteroidetes bacterium]|nr:PKD domain-containing protein [Bacteroidota bacterium]